MYMQNHILTIKNLYKMSAGKFTYSIVKKIYFHCILTNISNLFKQFIITPRDLQLQKISYYPG